MARASCAGKPVVTTDGGMVTVVGLGAGKSPDFELPAGSAQMTVTPCASNQVIPFVTLYDGNDTKLGIVVEPTYTLTNLTGGTYYLDVAANPGLRLADRDQPGLTVESSLAASAAAAARSAAASLAVTSAAWPATAAAPSAAAAA